MTAMAKTVGALTAALGLTAALMGGGRVAAAQRLTQPTSKVTTVSEREATQAIDKYERDHNMSGEKCIDGTCYGVGQTLGHLAVWWADYSGTVGGLSSTVFAVTDGHATPLWSSAGSIALTELRGLVPGRQVLLLQVNAVGDNGLYQGPFGVAMFGEAQETMLRVYSTSALTASNQHAFQEAQLWASPAIPGTVQTIPLLAAGRIGLVIRCFWALDFNKSGAVEPDSATMLASDPGRVWQWDSAMKAMVVGQVGLTVGPASKGGPYDGEQGVEVTSVGPVVGPEVNFGFGTGTPPPGLQVNALLTKVDGQRITSAAFLMLMIERTPIGGTVQLAGNFDTAPFAIVARSIPFPPSWSSTYLQIQAEPGAPEM
jgi:hypothetical protein